MRFSQKQRRVLTWWCRPGDWEAIICDGAVRSGKTFSMGLSFFLWAMARFNGRQLGLCGKTITSLRRNLLAELVPYLRRLGFDYVFDTNFSADLTIMEEGSEFLERFTHRDRYHWPMFTSCCPGWVRFIKSQFPHYVDCLSTAKSPQQMFGAVAKTYFAEKIGVDPHRMFVVSIMPCMAKKSECALPTMRDACGDPDVDAVLTTREMDRLFRSDNIQPGDLPEEAFCIRITSVRWKNVLRPSDWNLCEFKLFSLKLV